MDDDYRMMKASDLEWMRTRDGNWTKDPDVIEQENETFEEIVTFANCFAAKVRASKLVEYEIERKLIQQTINVDMDEINFRLLDAARQDKQQRINE